MTSLVNAEESCAVALRGLTKSYGTLKAVDNLTLEVKAGEILGFLGLNGAGKTTTIRILLDLLRPTGGQAFIFGRDCQKQGLEARSMIGYLPGEMGIYSDMTGQQALDFLAGLQSQRIDRRHRREVQDLLEFPDADLRRKLREYSTGMKRKLGLIQAFQSAPRLLILDEPTEGLDPLMQESFYKLLSEVRGRGSTVFMSSHVLSEVERVCDRIAVLRNGHLVLLATVEETRRLAPRRVRVFFSSGVERPATLPAAHEWITTEPREWYLRVEGVLGPLLELLRTMPVNDIEVQEPGIEDVILKYYRGGAA